MRAIALLVGILFLAAAAGCGGSGDSAEGSIARPRAYPRPAVYDTVYADRNLPAGFPVNLRAEVRDVTPGGERTTQARWIDIVYPAYGATVHCTFMPVTQATREDAAANRMERMMLNIGDRFADRTDLDSPTGFHSVILMTGAETPTPVQFVSVGERWVISGALQFADQQVRTDSVMPLLEAVRADLIHAAKTIGE